MNNIVFYSYTKSKYDHVNDHELKRFDHSIRSLREFNDEVPVYLFCDDPEFIPPYFSLEYNVRVLPFEKAHTHGMLFIYRWFNLQFFDKRSGEFDNANILYVDSDTLFYGNISLIIIIMQRYLVEKSLVSDMILILVVERV